VAASLLGFDGDARSGSAAALQFWYWREALRDGVDGVALREPDPLPRAGPVAPEQARTLTRAVARVVTTLAARPGGLARTLGDEFRITRGPHSFPLGGVSVAPVDLRGCESLTDLNRVCTMTLRAFTAGAPDSARRRHAIIGSRLLRLVVFTEPLQSWTLHNFGQTSRPDSPHYADQARLTSERRLKPVYFDRADLMPHVKSEITLEIP
jgi:acyl-homoserine lactone acylase PvdQ